MKTEFDKIIAGYTPLRWNSIPNSYVNDPTGTSFLLSIDMMQKMGLVNNACAIYCNPNQGPIFGGPPPNQGFVHVSLNQGIFGNSNSTINFGEGKDIFIADKCN